MIRAIDRCQLMILECAHELRIAARRVLGRTRERTGVVLGHMGATRSATLYAARCYLDDARAAALRTSGGRRVAAAGDAAGRGCASEVGRPRAAVERELVPGDDAQRHPRPDRQLLRPQGPEHDGRHGLLVRARRRSTSRSRYLRSGELDVALVGGANGNTTPEVRALLGDGLRDGAATSARARSCSP